MEIHVFDTYVTSKKGKTMHFDIITSGNKDIKKALEYGKKWLESIGEGDATLTSKECEFCHSQSAPKPIEDAIRKDGYYIQKMEGCP